MNERICQMWRDELIKQLKAGEKARKIFATSLPEQEIVPSMGGDEAIEQIKALMDSCDNEKDIEALKIAIDAIDEVWNEW